jgi:hypothetical protein
MKDFKRYYILSNLNILKPSVILLFIFIYVKFQLGIFFPHFCLFEKLFGIHCPLCGTTKSLQYLFNGDYLLSIRTSIVGIPFILYLFSYQFLLFYRKLIAIIQIEKALTFLLFINFIKQFLCQ